jgi:NADH dehydrogenase FAD-containing subunit
MSNKRQNIVVVGGGGVGAFLIQNLSAKLDPAKYNLILITPRPYFLHLIATIRLVVTSEGKLEDRVAIPLDKTFINGNGKMLVGKVVSISNSNEGEKGGHVTLASGETVDYSILVLATGSNWQGPLAIPDGKAELDKWAKIWRSKFEKAEDILLVGGGAVGVGT